METCPKCGYVDNSALLKSKPITAAMNAYVDPKTGKVDGMYNADDKSIKVGSGENQKELIRQDVWDKMQKEKTVSPPAKQTEPAK